MDKNTRHKDVNWKIKNNEDGSVPNMDAHLALLMDLRDELKEIQRRASIAELVRYQQRDILNRIDRRLQKHFPLTKRRRKK